jgi:hypothetical protein
MLLREIIITTIVRITLRENPEVLLMLHIVTTVLQKAKSMLATTDVKE